jgi:hypothetical protein
MRTTIDLPRDLFREVKLRAVREGVTMKEWFVGRLNEVVKAGDGEPAAGEAARFRRRFEGRFDPPEIDRFKRAGRA